MEGCYKIRTLGGFVYAMFAVFTMAIAVSFFYVGPSAAAAGAQLVLAIKIHVALRSSGRRSSLLGVGCLLTILFLIQDRRERRAVRRSARSSRRRSWAASIDVERPDAPPLRRGADEPVAIARHGRRAGAPCRRRPRWTALAYA